MMGCWSRVISSPWLRRVQLTVVLMLVAVLHGCDGEGTLTVIAPPEGMRGPRISGQVRLPNGDLAQSSVVDEVVAFLVQRVQALFSATVEPVGSGVEVQLVYVDPDDAVGGSLPSDLAVLASGLTNDNGQYQVFLPFETTADRCRYMVQVGDAGDGTLTRAFVFRSDGPVDIDFASEAVVRQILAALADGVADDLCDFESGDIATLYQAVLAIPGAVAGDSIAAVNNNANAAVTADSTFQTLLEDAALPGPIPPTRTPTATVAAVATATFTVTRTRTGTPTESPRPTRTEGATATQTPTASSTGTRPPTPSPTVTTVVTATPTNTVPPPTATNTPIIVVPTNTVPPPTATNTTVPTGTAPPATSTPTRSATHTATPSPSLTPTLSGARLEVGNVSGGVGMIVSVPVVLVGTSIVAVSADIEIDTSVLDVVLTQGSPDCSAAPTLPPNKRVVASLPTGLPAGQRVVRVGVIGTDNNDAIPGGTVFTCRFEIDAAAPLGPTALLITAGASDALGNAVGIAGSAGSVNVIASPPSLDIDMVVGTIGESLTISATLHSRGQSVSALSTDIAVGTAMLDVVLGDDQEPDCVVAEAIGSGTTPNKQVFAALVPDDAGNAVGGGAGTSLEVLRVGVVATDNNQVIPDGQVFTCQLAVPSSATPHTVALTHRPEGSSPTGGTVGLSGTPGQITIVEP